MKKQQQDSDRGFTLIELMVSLALFTIVVLAAVASLYTVNAASRKVQAMRTALDNLNFAIESMSRTIRTGTGVGCNSTYYANCPLITGNSPISGQDIILNSTLGYQGEVIYQINHDCDGNGTMRGCIEKQQGGSGNAFVALTSPEIDVKNLTFYVDGACDTTGNPSPSVFCTADTDQPGVTIFVQGVAKAGGSIAPFSIQTFVSERTIE